MQKFNKSDLDMIKIIKIKTRVQTFKGFYGEYSYHLNNDQFFIIVRKLYNNIIFFLNNFIKSSSVGVKKSFNYNIFFI